MARASNSLPLLIFASLLVGCAPPFSDSFASKKLDFSEVRGELEGPGGEPNDEIPATFELAICSDLSFDDVQWPAELNEEDINDFALALNVSGSFEGPLGWANLSNNFDGQGVSMGLLNQNLGQGSLQPLLLSLRNNHPNVFSSFFSPRQLESISTMLSGWEGEQVTSFSLAESQLRTYSFLDDLMQPFLTKRNQASVDWAVANLYEGSHFKPEWREALNNLGESPEYISLQIEAAKYLHKRARQYLEVYGFTELRSYLFFFDIAVQNGSIPSRIRDAYFDEWNGRSGTETQKLISLLEHRLTIVRRQYVEDVRSRKMTIIEGSGTVHGAHRRLEDEYCADLRTLYPNQLGPIN